MRVEIGDLEKGKHDNCTHPFWVPCGTDWNRLFLVAAKTSTKS